MPEGSVEHSLPINRWAAIYVLSVALLATSAAAAWMFYTSRQAERQAQRAEAALAATKTETAAWRKRLRRAQTAADRAQVDIDKLKNLLSRESTALAATKSRAAALLVQLQQLQRRAAATGDGATTLQEKLAAPSDLLPAKKPPPLGTEGAARKSQTAQPKPPPSAAPAARSSVRLQPTTGARTVVRRVNVRAKPSVKSALVTTLVPGQQIKLVAKTSDSAWHQVIADGKIRGFIKTTALLATSQ